jgi:carboxymethylenebutenolidase
MSREPATISEMVSYKGETGVIESYLSRPSEAAGKEHQPAVIVIHEIYGLVDHIKDVSNRFASQGYVALAPNLFSGDQNLRSTLTRANLDETFQFIQTLQRERMRDPSYVQQELSRAVESEEKRARISKTMQTMFGGIPRDKLTKDLAKAVEYLDGQSFVRRGKIGSVGFCFGGGLSINLACHVKLSGCVVFYGENPSPIDLVKNIECPVLGLYGAEDQRINANLDQLVRAMVQYKKDFAMRIFPRAGHAFFNDTSKATYVPYAAKESWEMALRFYSRTLGV